VAPELDLRREIDPGAHEIVAHAPGFLHTTAHFSVAAGAGASVALTLTRVAVVAGAPPIRGPLPMGDSTVALDPPAGPRSRGGPLPFVLMGLGGAVFGAGLTVGLVGVNEASHAPTRDGADASSARGKGIAGDVMGTLGIATAGVGLVLLLVQGRSSAPRGNASASVSGLKLRF
jgi:hypothetical protein